MTERKIIQRNFTQGRSGQYAQFVVLHTYNGTGRSLYGWFNNAIAQVSAHYGVFMDGNSEQYVDESNTAWANGNWDANIKAISIEHQDNGVPSDAVRTNELYEGTAQLIADIYRRYAWDKADMGKIRQHREFVGTGCPGALDIERIKRRVKEILNPNDNLYRVVNQDGTQVGAFTEVDNAFDTWYSKSNNGSVRYNGKDITSEFLNMAKQLEKKIGELEAVVTQKDTKIGELSTTVANLKTKQEALVKQRETLSKLLAENNYNSVEEVISDVVALRGELEEAQKGAVSKLVEKVLNLIFNRK